MTKGNNLNHVFNTELKFLTHTEDLHSGNGPQENSHLKTLPFEMLPTLQFCYF